MSKGQNLIILVEILNCHNFETMLIIKGLNMLLIWKGLHRGLNLYKDIIYVSTSWMLNIGDIQANLFAICKLTLILKTCISINYP